MLKRKSHKKMQKMTDEHVLLIELDVLSFLLHLMCASYGHELYMCFDLGHAIFTGVYAMYFFDLCSD